MSVSTGRARSAYRDFFTPDEARAFDAFETTIADLDRQRRQASSERRVLMNRAIQRAIAARSRG
jgi:hypothetical protein